MFVEIELVVIVLVIVFLLFFACSLFCSTSALICQTDGAGIRYLNVLI
jgi:hypothetical protein